jgi:septum formation protein
MKIILSSKSPRRIELVAKLGVPFEIRSIDTNETFLGCRTPSENTEHAAEKKARAAARGGVGKDEIILAADTVVVYGATVLGKPQNAREAAQFLRLLSATSSAPPACRAWADFSSKGLKGASIT